MNKESEEKFGGRCYIWLTAKEKKVASLRLEIRKTMITK